MEEQEEKEFLDQLDLETNPCENEIKVCHDLINYCNDLLNKQNAKEKQQEDEGQNFEGEGFIAPKEKDEENVMLKKKNKKQRSKKQAHLKNDEEEWPLQHTLQTMDAFDTIRVIPPQLTEKIPETLQIIQEKIKFFEKEGQQKLEEKKKIANLTKEERQKFLSEQKEQTQEKKQKKQKTNVDLQNEESFPGLK